MRTQKAQGVMALHKEGFNTPEFAIISDASELKEKFEAIYGWYESCFARPCPKEARHGFIDSRAISSLEELEKLWSTMIKVDPEGELLLMPVINSEINTVWRPGELVIGPGHDGATSGRNCLVIPLVNGGIPTSLSEAAGITGTPFIEAVYAAPGGYRSYLLKTVPYYTQLRNGPPQMPTGKDYVPATMEVKAVVKAMGDLLEWEQTCKGIKPGTVVYHEGGSLGSHYAVHCIMNGIPILTSHRPNVGEILEHHDETQVPDPEWVRKGILAGTSYPLPLETRGEAVAAVLVGFHNAMSFGGSSGFFLGAAAAIMHRVGTAASLGEARHARKHKLTREQIYEDAFADPFVARKKLRRATELFYHHKWESGYGNKSWAKCGESIIALDNAIQRTIRAPKKTQVDNLIHCLNSAVNQAHNNGWWLNKFIDSKWFDLASIGDARVAIFASRILWRLWKSDDLSSDIRWKKTRKIRMEKIRPSNKIGGVGILRPISNKTRWVPIMFYGDGTYSIGKWTIETPEHTEKFKNMPMMSLAELGQSVIGKSYTFYPIEYQRVDNIVQFMAFEHAVSLQVRSARE